MGRRAHTCLFRSPWLRPAGMEQGANGLADNLQTRGVRSSSGPGSGVMNVTAIGWVATVAFASSYLFRRPATLRKIQAAAAFLWVVYGLAIGAVPVVVAN